MVTASTTLHRDPFATTKSPYAVTMLCDAVLLAEGVDHFCSHFAPVLFGGNHSVSRVHVGSLFEQGCSVRFLDPMNELIGVALLRPVVVSVFERASVSAAGNVGEDDTSYNERLVVVRPNNWLIYTVNGVTFNYITNNVNQAVSKCTMPNALNAVEYRLRSLDEAADYTADRLKFSCVNYTTDQLIKIFGSYAQRTDIDMTDYFDKEKRSDAPMFTVENVLQFLVHNDLV